MPKWVSLSDLPRSESGVSMQWPRAGEIEFRRVWMKYRETLAPVLRGLSVKIDGGMRVGICGRTGAGKSSIMVALFRIVEIFQGEIFIDNVDIKSISLETLRLCALLWRSSS